MCWRTEFDSCCPHLFWLVLHSCCWRRRWNSAIDQDAGTLQLTKTLEPCQIPRCWNLLLKKMLEPCHWPRLWNPAVDQDAGTLQLINADASNALFRGMIFYCFDEVSSVRIVMMSCWNSPTAFLPKCMNIYYPVELFLYTEKERCKPAHYLHLACHSHLKTVPLVLVILPFNHSQSPVSCFFSCFFSRRSIEMNWYLYAGVIYLYFLLDNSFPLSRPGRHSPQLASRVYNVYNYVRLLGPWHIMHVRLCLHT